LGQKPAADRLMRAIEKVAADPSLHTPDLGCISGRRVD
jgi:tartrate dehydrogenase/decarboxylase / D-malate dehydrogenase